MYATNRYHYGINPKQVFELPATRQKSFYGKAKVIIDDNGDIYLQSYDTIVCYIDTNGKLIRLWNGYSVTTMNHINDFLALYDIAGGGKKWWEHLPVEKH